VEAIGLFVLFGKGVRFLLCATDEKDARAREPSVYKVLSKKALHTISIRYTLWRQF
jgi:hypothetical protein